MVLHNIDDALFFDDRSIILGRVLGEFSKSLDHAPSTISIYLTVITSSLEEILALVCSESVEPIPNDFPQGTHSACSGFVQQALELGKGKFNQVEFRRLRRQIEPFCTAAFNHWLDAGDFMSGQIIHDHPIAGDQSGQKELFVPGTETLCVDRSIKNPRGS